MSYQQNLINLHIELAKLSHQIQALAEEESKPEESEAEEESEGEESGEDGESEPEDGESEEDDEETSDDELEDSEPVEEDSEADEADDTEESEDEDASVSLVSAADTIVTQTVMPNGEIRDQVRDAKTGQFFSKPSSGKGEYDVSKVKDAYKQAFAGDNGDNLSWPTALVTKQDPKIGSYQEEVEKEPPTTGSKYDPQPISGDALTQWKIKEGAKELNDHGIKWPEVKKGWGTNETTPLPWPKSKGKYLQGEELIAWKVEKHQGSPKLLDTSDDGVSWPVNAVTRKPLPYPAVRDEGGKKIPLIGEELTHWKKKNGGHIDRDRAPKPPNMKQFAEKLAVYDDMVAALASVNLEVGDENDPATIAAIEFRQHLYDELELKIAQMAIDTLGGDMAGIVLEESELMKRVKDLKAQLGEFAGDKDLNKERDERVEFHKKILQERREENPLFFKMVANLTLGGSKAEKDLDKSIDEMAEKAADLAEAWDGLFEMPGLISHGMMAGAGMIIASPGVWWSNKPPEEQEKILGDIKANMSEAKKKTWDKWAQEIKEAQEAQSGTREERRQKAVEKLNKNVEDPNYDYTSYLMNSAEEETRKKEAFSRKAQVDTANNGNKPPGNLKQVDVKKKPRNWRQVTSKEELQKMMNGISELTREVSTSLIGTVAGFVGQSAAMTEMTTQVGKLLGPATKTGVDIQSEAQGRFIAAQTSEARFPHKPLTSFHNINEWEDDTYMCINKMNETSIIPLLLLWDLPEFQDYIKKELARVFPKRV